MNLTKKLGQSKDMVPKNGIQDQKRKENESNGQKYVKKSRETYQVGNWGKKHSMKITFMQDLNGNPEMN